VDLVSSNRKKQNVSAKELLSPIHHYAELALSISNIAGSLVPVKFI